MLKAVSIGFIIQVGIILFSVIDRNYGLLKTYSLYAGILFFALALLLSLSLVFPDYSTAYYAGHEDTEKENVSRVKWVLYLILVSLPNFVSFLVFSSI
ncbi:hypothetical protein [Brevibacillus agri]|uniref:hypothetical protein n=1 Tax=Brevibacillus agri TaxID=51101 RepID=UPI0002A4DCE7|nr:hypothetical protein [Brevibacillus agri]ELK38979.1 hypothetical protein D478_26823 [Brevibacillus agri BAB-2500]MBG9566353.1 hypothetical protein [Brevibacillus agri]MBY0054217.1 hypothetical protein [Brevibacillus agri]MDR9507420.1 hypothetical protein [Brevibacillus agri]MED3501530.1 hypothetical protein [Brevibacillus agri]